MKEERTEFIISMLKKAKTENFEEFSKLEKTIKELQEELNNHYAKTSGKQDLQKAFTNILKSSKKINSCRPALLYAFQDKEGNTCATDSYIALKVKDASGIALEKPERMEYQPPNMESLFNAYTDITEEINASVLKSAVSTAKAKSYRKHKMTALYRFSNGSLFDASKLLTGVLATGNNAVNLNSEKPFGIAKMQSKDENINFIICPYRAKDPVSFDENNIGYIEA